LSKLPDPVFFWMFAEDLQVGVPIFHGFRIAFLLTERKFWNMRQCQSVRLLFSEVDVYIKGKIGVGE